MSLSSLVMVNSSWVVRCLVSHIQLEGVVVAHELRVSDLVGV
jgi:hypothetical protein